MALEEIIDIIFNTFYYSFLIAVTIFQIIIVTKMSEIVKRSEYEYRINTNRKEL